MYWSYNRHCFDYFMQHNCYSTWCFIRTLAGTLRYSQMIKFLYIWLPRIFGCHCHNNRSFYYKGHKFPICARCSGELTGIIICFALFWFWKPTIGVAIFMMLPLVIDGFTQLLTKYESTNIRRFITGILFGIAFSSFFVETIRISFDCGVQYGRTRNLFNCSIF